MNRICPTRRTTAITRSESEFPRPVPAALLRQAAADNGAMQTQRNQIRAPAAAILERRQHPTEMKLYDKPLDNKLFTKP